MSQQKRLALLSVCDKDGIVEFARALIELGWGIIASGGTARTLNEAGVEAVDVAEWVGGEAILDHRVVTLSRELYAALLSRDNDEDRAELNRIGVAPIDLVCVDMYPIQKAIAADEATIESVRESTDIGGPAMLRAAAKSGRIVICNPADRESVLSWLRDGEQCSEAFRLEFAAKAEAVVASYGLASATFLSEGRVQGLVGEKAFGCCYGENKDQVPAALYATDLDDPLGVPNFQLVAGDDPSFINSTDVDRLLLTMTHLAASLEMMTGGVSCIAIAVKHGNPCGIGVSRTPQRAIERMIDGNRREIHGAVVMTNFFLGPQAADTLLTYGMDGKARRLIDGVVASRIGEGARNTLKRKRGKCRMFENPALANLGVGTVDTAPRIRPVRGGILIQPAYSPLDIRSVPGAVAVGRDVDLCVARVACATSNSNSIALAKNGMLIGAGVGQRDRVSCCELAIKGANEQGHGVNGAVAASDSFFPFPDGPEVLAKVGVSVVLATHGSVNDDKVRAMFAKHDVTFLSVPDEDGRGFAWH